VNNWNDSFDPIEAMRRWDVRQYLPDDLLVKVDRASMNAGLEVRAPFLDHRVVELAFAMPRHALIRDGVRKWALRQILYRHVPKAAVDRPKVGFAVPLADWLRGPLRDWAEDLLSESRLRDGGILDAGPIRTIWREHLSGRFDRSSYLWNVLMFESWMQTHAKR
jgi:asparagine synthase (glutamine-hydrolysing)